MGLCYYVSGRQVLANLRFSGMMRHLPGARDGVIMKADIHPKYEDITATCSCGNVIKTRSTVCEDIHLEVCSECHPFYTGQQKMIDSAGRIDRFNRRFGNRSVK